jgi:uncharacterized protein YjbJ (UPF0337 family)
MADLQSEGWMNRIKGKLRSTWGGLTDDEIDQSRGNLEQLVGKIQEKTGESSDSIRQRLQSMLAEDEPRETGRR